MPASVFMEKISGLTEFGSGLKAELVERLEREMQNDVPALDFGIGGTGVVIHERANESKEAEAAVADGEGIHRKVKLFSKEAQRGNRKLLVPEFGFDHLSDRICVARCFDGTVGK